MSISNLIFSNSFSKAQFNALESSSFSTKKNLIDQILEYISASQGISDVLDALDYGCQIICRIPLSQRLIQPIKSLGFGCGLSSSSLWMFDLFVDGKVLASSMVNFMRSFNQRKFSLISEQVGALAYHTGVVAGDAFEVSKFFLLCLGRTFSPFALGLGSLVWLGVDSADFVDQVKSGYRQVVAIGEAKNRKIRSRREVELSETLLKSARTVSAIAIDLLSVASAVFIVIQTSALVSSGILGLSVIFLAMNVSVYFYQKTHERQLIEFPLEKKASTLND